MIGASGPVRRIGGLLEDAQVTVRLRRLRVRVEAPRALIEAMASSVCRRASTHEEEVVPMRWRDPRSARSTDELQAAAVAAKVGCRAVCASAEAPKDARSTHGGTLACGTVGESCGAARLRRRPHGRRCWRRRDRGWYRRHRRWRRRCHVQCAKATAMHRPVASNGIVARPRRGRANRAADATVAGKHRTACMHAVTYDEDLAIRASARASPRADAMLARRPLVHDVARAIVGIGDFLGGRRVVCLEELEGHR